MPFPFVDVANIGPRVGQVFPRVQLPDQTGRIVDLHAERAGRRALVIFHRSAHL
jgi:hypothetical protein